MFFRQVLHEERSCASYLVGCQKKRTCAVIDPQGEPGRYLAVAERAGLPVTHVMDTHVHADHPSGALALAEASGAGLYLGERAEVGFGYRPLRDGEVLPVGNRRLTVIPTPGHTPEHVCVLVDDWFVLTGDTLFVGDVGRVDLALGEPDDGALTARARELHASLQRLLELPGETELFPGHFSGSTCGRHMDGKPVSTIGRERRRNRALAMDVEEFVAFQRENLPPLPSDFHRIKQENLAGVSPRERTQAPVT
ncbi:MAG: MBL fold metallo-hydrolase [Actinomycetota bacterium]